MSVLNWLAFLPISSSYDRASCGIRTFHYLEDKHKDDQQRPGRMLCTLVGQQENPGRAKRGGS